MKRSIALLMIACTFAVLPSVTFSRDTGGREKVPKTELVTPASVDLTFDVTVMNAYELDAVQVTMFHDVAVISYAPKEAKFNVQKTSGFDPAMAVHWRWCLCGKTMFLKSKTDYLLKPYPIVELPRNPVPRC